ncbi:hypothetical protein WJX77_008471 [Trebouxia sp. C0004]
MTHPAAAFALKFETDWVNIGAANSSGAIAAEVSQSGGYMPIYLLTEAMWDDLASESGNLSLLAKTQHRASAGGNSLVQANSNSADSMSADLTMLMETHEVVSPESSVGGFATYEDAGTGAVMLQHLRADSAARVHALRGLTGQGISRNSPAGSQRASFTTCSPSCYPTMPHNAQVKARDNSSGSSSCAGCSQSSFSHAQTQLGVPAQKKASKSFSGTRLRAFVQALRAESAAGEKPPQHGSRHGSITSTSSSKSFGSFCKMLQVPQLPRQTVKTN